MSINTLHKRDDDDDDDDDDNNQGLIKLDYQFVISKDVSEEGFSIILHLSEKETDRIVNENRQKPRRS